MIISNYLIKTSEVDKKTLRSKVEIQRLLNLTRQIKNQNTNYKITLSINLALKEINQLTMLKSSKNIVDKFSYQRLKGVTILRLYSVLYTRSHKIQYITIKIITKLTNTTNGYKNSEIDSKRFPSRYLFYY